ncbi:hypothetical protein SB767_31540, partial [Bacillus sp. SIMBA_069]
MLFAEFTITWPGLLSPAAGAVQLAPAGVVKAIRMFWLAPGASAGPMMRTAVGFAGFVVVQPTVFPVMLPGVP